MKCNEKYIYAGTTAGNLYQLMLPSLKEKNSLCIHKEKITRLRALPNGRVATSSHDNLIKVWEPVEKTFKCRKILKGHEKYVADFAVCGNNQLVSGGQGMKLMLWDYQNKKLLKTVETAHKKVIEGITCLKDSIVTCSGDFSIKVWDRKDLTEKLTLKGHKANINRVCGCYKDTKIISGSADPSVKMWDLESGKCEATFSNKEDPIMEVAMINGHVVGAGSIDNKMYLYDIRNSKEIKSYEMDPFEMMITGMIRSICTLDSDRYFAAGSTDWNLRVYDIRGKSEAIKEVNLKDGIETICTNS